MTINIIRYRRKTENGPAGPVEIIDGHLYINGSTKICDTAENALRALPAGTYPVCILKCHQHSRKMPLIAPKNNCRPCAKLGFVCCNSSMPRHCPMLTSGNGVYNRTDGAILLGEFLVPGCLKHSRESFERVYQMMRKASEGGHEITLIIIENL